MTTGQGAHGLHGRHHGLDRGQPLAHLHREGTTCPAMVTGRDELTALAVQDITVGNTRPEATIQQPPDGGTFSFGDTIPFTVEVTDEEDGQSGPIDCSRARCSPQPGHDTHLHPLDNYTGCNGQIVTDAGDSHGSATTPANGITAQYEDKGAPDAPALTGSTSLTLRTSYREAEHFTSTGGGNGGAEVGSRADASGGKRLIEIEDGDWVAFDPVNLKGVESGAEVGASSAASVQEVPAGPHRHEVARFGDRSEHWAGREARSRRRRSPRIRADAAAAGRSPTGSAPPAAHRPRLDGLHFNGPGVEKAGGTKVKLKAQPASGTAPFTRRAQQQAPAGEGRTISLTHWDFGDNVKPFAREGRRQRRGGAAATSARCSHRGTARGDRTGPAGTARPVPGSRPARRIRSRTAAARGRRRHRPRTDPDRQGDGPLRPGSLPLLHRAPGRSAQRPTRLTTMPRPRWHGRRPARRRLSGRPRTAARPGRGVPRLGHRRTPPLPAAPGRPGTRLCGPAGHAGRGPVRCWARSCRSSPPGTPALRWPPRWTK
ncbi:hypothetical protein SMICM17S_12734 [Streptomyces microflavus]